MVKNQSRSTKSVSAPQTAAHLAAQADFMPTIRELVRTYQAFSTYSERHIREMGLTPPQFDVIATLGNTDGMSMKAVAEKTLVTKGTLTGIIDRLEEKHLVRREVPDGNRRSFTLVLTPEGQHLFEQVFPAHISYLKERFDRLDKSDLQQLQALLGKLRQIF